MITSGRQREAALEIIHKIKLAKSSQAKIAKINNVKPAAVWNVIWGRAESKKIKQTIASVTNEHIENLWPDTEKDKASSEQRKEPTVFHVLSASERAGLNIDAA